MRATLATAIRNGNANQPPASAPIAPTAATETSAVAVGTKCGRCGKQFKTQLGDTNLRQHQESTACKPITNQSSQAGPVNGAPDTPIPLQSSMPLASADDPEEELRAADAKASKKRLQKQAEKRRKQERDRMAKEAKQLRAEAERANLEVAREARLDELRQRAVHDPSLLEAICSQDKACKDGACILMHHCTRSTQRWECRNLVRGARSNSTKPGHSARQLHCDDCQEYSRARCQKYKASLTKEEKRDIEKKKKRTRDGDKQPGTANPVARLELAFDSLKPKILGHPDFDMLNQSTDLSKMLVVLDFEFSSVNCKLPVPSEIGHVNPFQVCVRDFHSEEIKLDKLLNFLPKEYADDPLGYLKKMHPNNWQRAVDSLARVHGVTLADTDECNSELAERLKACPPIAEIVADLAAIARELKAKNGLWAAHGDSPEKGILRALQKHLGPDEFPPIDVLNSLAILTTIATYTRGEYYKTGDPSTKVPCALGGAYSAMTGTELPDAHIASGDCLGTIRVLKGIQECRERCEAKSR